jgi:hypothetical protein
MDIQHTGKIDIREQRAMKWETPYCTYMIERAEKLGYEKTKEDLGRVLAKIELGI